MLFISNPRLPLVFSSLRDLTIKGATPDSITVENWTNFVRVVRVVTRAQSIAVATTVGLHVSWNNQGQLRL